LDGIEKADAIVNSIVIAKSLKSSAQKHRTQKVSPTLSRVSPTLGARTDGSVTNYGQNADTKGHAAKFGNLHLPESPAATILSLMDASPSSRIYP
jgi:hypothetical protein